MEIDNIDQELIYSGSFRTTQTLPLHVILEPNPSTHYEGALEELQNEIDALRHALGKILAYFVVNKHMTLEEAKFISNVSGKVFGIDDEFIVEDE